MSALLHRPFRMMLVSISRHGGTLMERDLATVALDLYDTNPDDPRIEAIVTEFTQRALSHES
jgi:hypothetical protein